MPKMDLTSEWAFYGAKLDSIGQLYFHPKDMKAAFPDTLFFLYVTTHLLTDKKLTISGATFIHDHLDHSEENWLKILNWEEGRPFSCPCRLVPYRGYAKSCFSASLMLREEPKFRMGYMGFGFFSNKKYFDFCAGGAVYGLIETVYNAWSKAPDYSRDDDPDADYVTCRRVLTEEGLEAMRTLFAAAATLRRIRLGQDLAKGNWRAVADLIYRKVTGENYPSVSPEDEGKWGPAVDRAYAAYLTAGERTADPGPQTDTTTAEHEVAQ